MPMSKVQVRIKASTRDKLKELGKMGMTFDEVIQALIRCKELSDEIYTGEESPYWERALREMF